MMGICSKSPKQTLGSSLFALFGSNSPMAALDLVSVLHVKMTPNV